MSETLDSHFSALKDRLDSLEENVIGAISNENAVRIKNLEEIV